MGHGPGDPPRRQPCCVIPAAPGYSGRRVLTFAACALALLLAACASGPLPSSSPNPPAPNVNLSGYPLAFRQGYADGCASAKGRQLRDEARMKGEAQYALGWRDGKDICGRR